MFNKGYVYDKSGNFWDDSFTPKQLKQMEESYYPNIRYIRHNLYSQKIKAEEYKLIFVNTEHPHFRRWSISDAERNGFSSVCESLIHKACKLGIANAERIRIRINGNDYILNKKSSDTETLYLLLGNKYETDCEYAILDIDKELQTLLGGDVLYFEIHHKSAVNQNKIRAYYICGINMLEFDIQTKYLPNDVKNEILDEEQMVQYFKNYYEDVGKHYIHGTFLPPMTSDIEWNGGMTKVYDQTNDKEIEIKIYKDRFSKKKQYNIIFICEGKKYTQ